MFMPLRIDHHGWQLACLALTLAGIADPKGARGGVIVGLSSAASLTIGLELLPYCAIAGAIVTLRWVWDGGEVRRMQAYALSLAGGSTIGFAVFASNANYAMRCDALTPVWLSVTIAAGLLLFAISLLNPANRVARLGLAAVAGAAIAGGFAALFPQCLSRPRACATDLPPQLCDGVPDRGSSGDRDHRRRRRSLARPCIGGAADQLDRDRAVHRLRRSDAAMADPCRTGGAAARHPRRDCGGVDDRAVVPQSEVYGGTRRRRGVAFLLFSGLFTGFVVKYVKVDKPQKARSVVNRANARCASAPGMSLIDRSLPPATLFTMSIWGHG
ncbi:hypothetical protein DdX_20594 [Ditylenchus destructor]|uniref:Uncharacterized protein n=1 Tax=Ditylenchus destructor TaxID=166010 RepID=A0AAD4QW94_9BILA|nr:hypothetical protein DdX_20594 [Ditylenchus destructor]